MTYFQDHRKEVLEKSKIRYYKNKEKHKDDFRIPIYSRKYIEVNFIDNVEYEKNIELNKTRIKYIKRENQKKANIRYQEKNIEKYREYRKIYMSNYFSSNSNKELLRCRNIKRYHNLTLEEYIEITKNGCAICGFKHLVDIHHIDKNNKNNIPSNRIPLCPNHHFLIHRRGLNIEELYGLEKPQQIIIHR